MLDAPDLQDDFYLNLVDWSYSNVLTVGLNASVYLWSACTSQVKFLLEHILLFYIFTVLALMILFCLCFLPSFNFIITDHLKNLKL